MASNRIKGITIQIGGDTTKLDKALDEVDTQLKKTQGSLKEVDRLLKMDPGNTELLAQKQRLLADALEKSKKRADTLNEAMSHANEELSRDIKFKEKYSPLLKSLDEAASAYEKLKDKKADMDKQMELGEISTEQYDAWNSKMKESQENLKDLRKQVADAKAEMGGPMMDQSQFDTLQRELIETEINIKKIEDAANEASSGLDGLSGSSEEVSGGLDMAKEAAVGASRFIGEKLVDGAMAASEWMWNLSESTEEYRVAMGKLNTAYDAAGLSAETARKAYEGFYKILGDTDTATEASQLLAQLVDNEEDIAKWTEIAAGVYGTFGDALPIEGLIEAANETAKTGKVTGVLADALNWVGMSEDKFNDILAKTADEGQRTQLIMNNLGMAYENAAEAFYKNNEGIMESREATLSFQQAMAELATSMQPIISMLAEIAATFANWFSGIPEGAKAAVVGISTFVAVISPIAGIVSAITAALSAAGIASRVFSVAGLGVSATLGQWVGIIGIVIGLVLALAAAIAFLTGRSKEMENMKMPDVPNYGAASSRGRSVAEPYSLMAATPENIPYLARGTVTRPNNPFLAVVGDNPTEPEIVSPLSTIEQAVRNVVGGGGAQSSVPRSANITLVLNGSVIGRVFTPLVDGYHEIQGVNLVKT